MNKKIMPTLPPNWIWTSFGQVCLAPQYGWTTSASDKGKLKLLRTSDITSGSINWNSVPFCKKEPPEKEKYLLKDGDIVISRAGSVGYSLLINNPKEAVFASYLIRFQPLIDKCYVSFFMKSSSYWRNISEKRLGIAVPNVNATKLKQIPIPFPPLPEQHRIVAKIEEVFSDLDAGVGALKNVKEKLKQYRQAVLKHAFEGKLTADWRQRMLNDELRILNEKDSLSRFKIDNTDLPDLPKGGLWIKFENILEKVEKVNPKSEPNKQFIYLDIASIDNSLKKITSPKKYFGTEAPSRARQLVKSGDILFSTVRTYLKNIAFVDEKYHNQIASTGFCVIRPKERINKKYIFYLVQADSFLNPLNEIQRGTSYPAVRNSDVFSQIIPILQENEQDQIVEEIERRFSIADKVEKVVEQSLNQSERLRRSILKKAFEGRLVPQDPTDESAARLLEQIKEEKAKYEVAVKAKKKNKRKVNKKQRRLFENE